MKVVSFSLWGSDDKYLSGTLANLELVAEYYPGWVCRCYCGDDVPEEWRQKLADAGFQVMVRHTNAFTGLFWRFEAVFDPEVELFICRDSDSRVNPREAAAVEEWLRSGKPFHSMRDHYEHTVPIMGGMWGSYAWPDFKKLLQAWPLSGRMGDDQDFLTQRVWPLVRNNSISHDRYCEDTTVDTPTGPFAYKPITFYGEHDVRPFPQHAPLDIAVHGNHVGARVTPK